MPVSEGQLVHRWLVLRPVNRSGDLKARVGGKERADRLRSTAHVTRSLQLSTAEVLSGLRNFEKLRIS